MLIHMESSVPYIFTEAWRSRLKVARIPRSERVRVRIILSRKGFDSSAGSGVSASPIFGDGSLLSMPIPDRASRQCYADLRSPIAGYENLGEIVDSMPTRAVRATDGVHLDPDLDADSIARLPGWRPLFGQTSAAQTHLANNDVAVGDLFIMFGWFREMVERSGRLVWKPGSPDVHVIFGWLQIGEMWHIGTNPTGVPSWAEYHPHSVSGEYPSNNTLYVASEKLSLPGVPTTGVPGAGVFRKHDERRRLTAPNASRSKWRLPAWFDPHRTDKALTYHPRISTEPGSATTKARAAQWRVFDSHVELDTVGKGQEFVFDADVYPEALGWFAAMCRCLSDSGVGVSAKHVQAHQDPRPRRSGA